MDTELIFHVVRDHFQREDYRLRHLSYSKCFNDMFKVLYPYSEKDHYSYSPEVTIESMIDTLEIISDNLLEKYGYTNCEHMRNCHQVPLIHRFWKFNQNLDALLLPDTQVNTIKWLKNFYN